MAILIQPLFFTSIDLSEIIIQINTGYTIITLRYNGLAQQLHSHNLFSHPLWQTIDNMSFSVIPINDRDDSIFTHSIMNDPSDLVYLLIQFSEETKITKGDQPIITILLPNGITRSIMINIPFSTKPIVDLL